MTAAPRRLPRLLAPAALPPALALAALVIAALVQAAAAPAHAEPPIWRVRGPDGAQVTLFGSVHLLSQTTAWRGAKLEAALKGADRLMFEVPLDPAAQASAASAAMAQGLLPAGETLSGLLSADGRVRLTREIAALGANAAVMERLRPWLAEVTLSVLYFQTRGARADLGVEKQIDAQTPPTTPRGALETVQDQIDALAGASAEDQVKSLEETLREIEEEPDSFDKLAAAWVRGDVRAIEHEGLDDLRRHAPGAFARLVVDRNHRWTPEIEALLRGHERVVVVVGVGHLVGSDGVPAQLRRDGFTVEGP